MAIERIVYGKDYNCKNYSKFICDTEADIQLLYSCTDYAIGSEAEVIEDGSRWIYNSSDTWVKKGAGSESGGSDITPIDAPKVFLLDTVAGTNIKINFDVDGYEWLIINKTEDEMHVSFKEEYLSDGQVKTKAWPVLAESNRLVRINKESSAHSSSTLWIKPLITMEKGLYVECVAWKE